MLHCHINVWQWFFVNLNNDCQYLGIYNMNNNQIKIFTFWENINGAGMPAYIKLCMETWGKYIAGSEVICINYDNLEEYIGKDTYDIERLKKLTLPCQSDLISFALLLKHGGLWLDADTILTKNFLETLNLPSDKILMFGEHLAFIFAREANNPALSDLVEMAKERLSTIEYEKLINRGYGWDYFGNQMLTKIKANHPDSFHSIHPTEAGFIPENALFHNVPYGPGRYQALYFKQNDIHVEHVIEKSKFGLIGLHNSWTPTDYKTIIDRAQVLNRSELMSALLAKILEEERGLFSREELQSMLPTYFTQCAVSNNFNEYVDKYIDYNHTSKDLIIIISVKDEASKQFSKIVGSWKKLGLSIELTNKLRFSYVAIIDYYSKHEEIAKTSNHCIKQNIVIEGVKIEAQSCGFDAGNNAMIKINDIDYSRNSRGLNVVVFSKKMNKVVDLFSVDSYSNEIVIR